LRTPAAPPLLSLEEEHRLAEELFQRLARLSATERTLLVEKSPCFQTWHLAVRLCEASRDAAADSASAALEWAHLAFGVTRQVKGVEETWRERLEGFALGHVANAKKVENDLLEAERTFGKAWGLWKKGGELRDEVLEVAWLLGMEASLLSDQGRFHQSLQKLEQALELAGAERVKAILAIAKAHTLRHQEDCQGAITAHGGAPHQPLRAGSI
jgi:hypothetical protein